jgi:hypothetical protein
MVRDCVKGSCAIKKRANVGDGANISGNSIASLPGTRYLPAPNACDVSSENIERYRSYLARAVFVNFTAATKEGFLGMVFRRDSEIKLPASLAYLEENANGAGLALDQQIRETVGDTIETGRYGLLVDYPDAEPGLTASQVRARNLQARILPYTAESIINWRCTIIDGQRLLSLVVLQEDVELVDSDGFGAAMSVQYRVLMLVDGVYVQAIYDKEGNAIGDPYVPRKFSGSSWNRIPFFFVGSQNNDESVDKSLLYDIGELNVAHYRNSADYEESSFMTGQPTPWASGLTQTWVSEVMGGKLNIGSRAAVLLPEGGAFGLAQANPNQMPQQGMLDKETQLVKIGANIISDMSGNMRVDQIKMIFSGKTSKLALLVSNVEQAYYSALAACAEFMGSSTEEAEVKINKEFFDASLDPQQVMASIALLDRGIIAAQDMRWQLRTGGLISHDRTDEDIEAEAETADPML